MNSWMYVMHGEEQDEHGLPRPWAAYSVHVVSKSKGQVHEAVISPMTEAAKVHKLIPFVFGPLSEERLLQEVEETLKEAHPGLKMKKGKLS